MSFYDFDPILLFHFLNIHALRICQHFFSFFKSNLAYALSVKELCNFDTLIVFLFESKIHVLRRQYFLLLAQKPQMLSRQALNCWLCGKLIVLEDNILAILQRALLVISLGSIKIEQASFIQGNQSQFIIDSFSKCQFYFMEEYSNNSNKRIYNIM